MSNTTHEGYPIYFRRPDIRVCEFESLRPQFPVLLVITHHLSVVKSNGLPESDYNRSLEDLDSALLEPFSGEVHGLVAVVETFAGKRTYYVYVNASFDLDQFERAITSRNADARLTWERDDDPTWRLLRGYATDFRFP
ncbi:DUF695 domain-containing protein [Lysobacter sp. FW306-1B-D06B]|uniref:DUF695 domain-containing protein n=1 Tax=Lysobacter sp. FW306-1B-D06B TaxID=3140250 RepID=UPI003140ABB4